MTSKVMLLNSNFQFLDFINWQKAVTLIFQNKAEAVKESDHVITAAGGFQMKCPTVIRIMKTVKMIYKNEVTYSKRSVFIRDNVTCQYCGKKLKLNGLLKEKPTLDHVFPRALGGRSTWENSVTACTECNWKKADMTLQKSGMKLKSEPRCPTVAEFLNAKMKLLNVQSILDNLWT